MSVGVKSKLINPKGNKVRLADFSTLTFDCYGTLIDWETGIYNGLSPLLARAEPGLDRDGVLAAFSRHEVAQQTETPAMIYSDVLTEVYRSLSREWGVALRADEHEVFGRSVTNWPVFSDTVAALRYLKRYCKLVILSNVDRSSFWKSNQKMGVEFDAIFTAQDIGSYKPSLNNFHYMIEQLAAVGCKKNQILHTAQSMFHDHLPANSVGLSSAWIDRRRGMEGWGATAKPARMARVDFKFTSLAEMAEAHRRELD